jgi:hypothetical protein
MFTPLTPSCQGWLNPRNRGCKCGIGFGGRLRCHILAQRLPRRPKRRHAHLPKQHDLDAATLDASTGFDVEAVVSKMLADAQVPLGSGFSDPVIRSLILDGYLSA